jgi:hypothetical protein
MQSLHASKLIPPGLSADNTSSDDDGAVITIHPTGANSHCPSCGVVSDRVHSRYSRRLADVPIAGRRVALMLQARRLALRELASAQGRRVQTDRYRENGRDFTIPLIAILPRLHEKKRLFSEGEDRMMPRARPIDHPLPTGELESRQRTKIWRVVKSVWANNDHVARTRDRHDKLLTFWMAFKRGDSSREKEAVSFKD